MEWWQSLGDEPDKKYAWLSKLKKEGHEVKKLDSEPVISLYEQTILQASFACQSPTDIYSYCRMCHITDMLTFNELVMRCKEYHARD